MTAAAVDLSDFSLWRNGFPDELFAELRRPQHAGACASCGLFDNCRGGCMAAKFFTGLPLAGPDPECVLGHGERLLADRGDSPIPKPSVDMSRRPPRRAPARVCTESPLDVVQAR